MSGNCIENYESLTRLSKEYVIEDNDQVFAVDLDSFLLDVFCNSSLDWKHGPPILHCIYLVEKFIGLLQKNGRDFDFVSLDVLKQCVISDQLRFLREVCVCHIAAHTGIRVHTSVGWWSPDFDAYMKSRAVAFVVLGTGFATTSIHGHYDSNIVSYLKQYSLHILSTYSRCVRSSEMEFDVTSITAFEVTLAPRMTKQKVAAMLPSEIPVKVPAAPMVDAKLWKQLQDVIGPK
jgi:hypothetical protein